MHKDMRKKRSETSIVGPNKNTATTQDLHLNRQHLDCTHTLFFQFLLLLPRPTGRGVNHKKYETYDKAKSKQTQPLTSLRKKKKYNQLQVRPVTSHFRNVTKRFHFFQMWPWFKKKKQLAFGSSVKWGSIEPNHKQGGFHSNWVKAITYGMLSLQIFFWVHNAQRDVKALMVTFYTLTFYLCVSWGYSHQRDISWIIFYGSFSQP